MEVVLGDARLSLEQEFLRRGPRQFDILVLDAFSGDSVPTHLLTKEAFAIYRKHLAPGGAIATHITNTYLHLAPVVRKLADDAGLEYVALYMKADEDPLAYRNYWMILSHDRGLLQAIPAKGPPAELADDFEVPLWTDHYSNLFQISAVEIAVWGRCAGQPVSMRSRGRHSAGRPQPSPRRWIRRPRIPASGHNGAAAPPAIMHPAAMVFRLRGILGSSIPPPIAGWGVPTRRSAGSPAGQQHLWQPRGGRWQSVLRHQQRSGLPAPISAAGGPGCLLCFNAADGRFLWQHSCEKLSAGRSGRLAGAGVVLRPLVEGKRLWTVTNRGEVVCLDTEGFAVATTGVPRPTPARAIPTSSGPST